MKSFGGKLTLKRALLAMGLMLTSCLCGGNTAHAEKLRALFGDGSVRYTSAGPIGLNNDQNVLIGLLIPAVQKAQASIHIVSDTGAVLATKTVTIPDNFTGNFYNIAYTVSVDDSGNISITDGTNTELIGLLSNAHDISVLIGLLVPAVQKIREPAMRMHTGSVQIVNKRTGDINFILPFIEQAVVAKSVALGR